MITHHWVNTTQLTPGIEKYYPVFRAFTQFMPIQILRNKFDSNSGLYLVGDEKFLETVKKGIMEIITKVEKKGDNKKFKTGLMHVTSQRAKFKSQLALEAAQLFETGMKKERLNLSKNDLWEEKKQRELCNEYIKQISSLRILKPFK